LALQGLRGHIDFDIYQQNFDRLYLYSENEIVDVLGRTVKFGSDNCIHVCYGGKKKDWGRAEHWYHTRAELIGWIKDALTSPDVYIRHDKEFFDNNKYLMKLPDLDLEGVKPFYCVIVNCLSATEVEFITAYDIDVDNYRAYKNVVPPIYPSSEAKKIKRRANKKKRG